MKTILLTCLFIVNTITIQATEYHVGPNQSLTTIAAVPWDNLQAGDKIFIHWKSSPYKEKWVINAQGTANQRIEIIGVNGPNDQQPIIDGDGATTPQNLDYWNETRSVIKIGGSSIPADGTPSYITLENLDIKSGHKNYQFTDDSGNMGTYDNNASAILIEKGQHIIIRNCTIHDSGNGLFIASSNGLTQHILIEKNYIYGNGNVGRFYEHNTYTEATDIIYQYNRFGPLRAGADGNNLKDRSAGLVVRYNWIEGGNRQLDLVDGDHSGDDSYHTTHVYGNILIEPNGDGNSQIVHYGGDSGINSIYRKGDLYFYNNTVISYRTGNTTLVRLSSMDETAHIFNNVIYTVANGNRFAIIDGTGIANLNNNWLKSDWQDCHCNPSGSVNDLGNNISGTDPLFEDFMNQNYSPTQNSELVDHGDALPSILLPSYNIIHQYIRHQDFSNRVLSGTLDIGAYEFTDMTNGINIPNLDQIGIYPNPVKRQFTIDSKGKIFSLKIFSTMGIEVKSIPSLNGATQIDVSNLQSGIFILQLETVNGMELYKLVVE